MSHSLAFEMRFLVHAVYIAALALLLYIQATEGSQHRSNHYSLRRQIRELRSELEANDAANEININAVANTVQDAHDRIDTLEKK